MKNPIFGSALLFFALFTIVSQGCTVCEEPVEPAVDCYDEGLLDSQAGCQFVYEPVCGCDNITYYNVCKAQSEFGVTSFTEGQCAGCPSGIQGVVVNHPGEYCDLVIQINGGGILVPYNMWDLSLSAGQVIRFEYEQVDFFCGTGMCNAGEHVMVTCLTVENSEG